MTTVLLHIENDIAQITFNRAESMNVLDDVMIHEFAKITETVYHDPKVRAVLLSGKGPMFMAGGDIRYFHEHIDQSSENVKKVVNTLNKGVAFLLKMPKPVLASVQGSVAGAGLSIMLAADLVIAEEGTKFTTAYSSIGMSPDGGMSYTLPRVVGLKKAAELILLSEIIDAKQAQTLGLVNFVVPQNQLAEQTQKLLHRLAKGPTCAFAHSKELINQSQESSLEALLKEEAEKFATCYASQDFEQGVTAFLKKTRPNFVGK